MKKKNKLKLYRETFKTILTFSVIGAYGITGFSHGFNNLNKTLIRDYESIRYNKNKLIDHIEEDNLTKKDINSLDKICFLKLDMSEEKDLYYLKYFTNLKYLEIYNADYLTDLMIEEINNSTVEEINLYFDRTYAIKNIRNKFDLSRFKDKSKIKNVYFSDNSNSKEIDSIILFEYLTNYEGFNLDIYKYEELNNKLDNIIEELDLDLETYNNIDNLFKITKYVLDKINYDKKVSEYNSKHNKMYIFTPIYRKTVNYNENSLSLILDSDLEADGVCTNYSDLELALSLKGNVCVNTVRGEFNQIGHVWNVALFKDYQFYFDTSYLDTSDKFSTLLSKYLETHSDEDFKKIVDYFVIDFKSERGVNYKTDLPLKYYTDDELDKTNKHYIYGTDASEFEILFNAFKGFLSFELLCCIVVISEIIKRKIKDKKDNKQLVK